MKKKFICILLMMLGFIGIAGITVAASEDIPTCVLEEGCDVSVNDVNQESIMPMSSGMDYSEKIKNPLEEFKKQYPAYSWELFYEKSTENVSNAIPVNINTYPFPSSDIHKAIEEAGIKSSYGGCGPIAMIGLLYYFAGYLGYKEIMEDPYNYEQRIQLATDIFKNIPTTELPVMNSSLDIQPYSGSNNKNTLALPWDCVDGVNKVLGEYGLSNKLRAYYTGSTVIGGHKKEYLDIITTHIDKGIPVAVYTGLGTGDGPFSKHYFNAFEYKKYIGVDDNNNIIEKCAIRACLNWNDKESADYYFDADLLNSAMCGVVYIDPIYSHSEMIHASDFSTVFVNENNQGEYFFYEKSAPIITENGYTFGTVRLRCGYIENQYLVLSAKRANAGQAYLEFDLNEQIKGFDFDASLWSSNEGLTSADIFRIEYKKGNEWIPHVQFDITLMSLLKSNLYPYKVLFPDGVTSFRFFVNTNRPTEERNKGRIVLDNIHLYLN